eukprot:3121791-Karenia_brevis.AAC.1
MLLSNTQTWLLQRIMCAALQPIYGNGCTGWDGVAVCDKFRVMVVMAGIDQNRSATLVCKPSKCSPSP